MDSKIINKKYTKVNGAGIMILTLYKRTTKINDKFRLGIILFEDWRSTFTDAGGIKDKGESPSSTAIRETFEESRGLFKFRKPNLRSEYTIKLASKDKYYYISYYVYLKTIPKLYKYFYHNSKIIDKNPYSPKCWKETRGITIVDVEDLLKSSLVLNKTNINIAKHTFATTDIYSKKIFISTRALNSFKKAYKTGLLDKLISSKKPKDIEVFKNDYKTHKFLENTYCYVVKN